MIYLLLRMKKVLLSCLDKAKIVLGSVAFAKKVPADFLRL